MNTIKEWAEFYRDKRLWVYTYNLEEPKWLYWKNLKEKEEYASLFQSYDWNTATGIKLVVGKKGARVVEVSNKQLLKKTLVLLGLPLDYPWIIYSQSGYGIIIDTPSISSKVSGMGNRSFKNALFLWEGYYVLPSVGIPRYFYNNQIPQGHPKQVEDETFLSCINKLSI